MVVVEMNIFLLLEKDLELAKDVLGHIGVVYYAHIVVLKKWVVFA